MDTLKYIKDLLLKNKYKYVLGVIFLLCVDVLQLIIPKILGDATDLLKAGTLTRL
jgi:ATP-binding cassette subfamily B protein